MVLKFMILIAMLKNIVHTLALESVSFKIASFFFRSQMTHLCEKVEARICCTASESKKKCKYIFQFGSLFNF